MFPTVANPAEYLKYLEEINQIEAFIINKEKKDLIKKRNVEFGDEGILEHQKRTNHMIEYATSKVMILTLMLPNDNLLNAIRVMDEALIKSFRPRSKVNNLLIAIFNIDRV